MISACATASFFLRPSSNLSSSPFSSLLFFSSSSFACRSSTRVLQSPVILFLSPGSVFCSSSTWLVNRSISFSRLPILATRLWFSFSISSFSLIASFKAVSIPYVSSISTSTCVSLSHLNVSLRSALLTRRTRGIPSNEFLRFLLLSRRERTLWEAPFSLT